MLYNNPRDALLAGFYLEPASVDGYYYLRHHDREFYETCFPLAVKKSLYQRDNYLEDAYRILGTATYRTRLIHADHKIASAML